MSRTAPQPTTASAESLARIVEGLCDAIATACEERPASPVKRLVLTQLRRVAVWFAALIEDFRAGLLAPEPEATRRAPEFPVSPQTPARPPHLLRRGFGWLLRLVPGTAAFDRQVQDWLFGPEMGGAAGAVVANPPPSHPAQPETGDQAAPALGSPRRGASSSPAAAANGPAVALASCPDATLSLGCADTLSSGRAAAPRARPPDRDPTGRVRRDPSPLQPSFAVAVRSLFIAAAGSLVDPPSFFARA